MTNLAPAPASGKPLDVAHPLDSAPPWALLGLLPSRLANIPADARQVLGRALDSGRARLVLDDDGAALVFPVARS